MVRAHVPRMTLDELFEQKNDVAKAVLEELEKVINSSFSVFDEAAAKFVLSQCIDSYRNILMVDLLPVPDLF